jgi:hypothetical protein
MPAEIRLKILVRPPAPRSLGGAEPAAARVKSLIAKSAFPDV